MNAHKNLKRSSTDSLTIDDVDEMIYMNTASLENIKGHEQAEQTQLTNDASISNVYPEALSPAKNKKSKHDHLKGMTDILRGGTDNLASAINRISSMPPIPENLIWQMVQEMNLESRSVPKEEAISGGLDTNYCLGGALSRSKVVKIGKETNLDYYPRVLNP
ncbi:hypothetical protein HAX54_013988 [Datura stramonium]|uniref:Uncharacterized protein n=1 Tax=Datura stramonium TaxID=4076 RepID=A0ABS8RYP6_DATST|nr:hypothetical protein [Datura stramonium]